MKVSMEMKILVNALTAYKNERVQWTSGRSSCYRCCYCRCHCCCWLPTRKCSCRFSSSSWGSVVWAACYWSARRWMRSCRVWRRWIADSVGSGRRALCSTCSWCCCARSATRPETRWTSWGCARLFVCAARTERRRPSRWAAASSRTSRRTTGVSQSAHRRLLLLLHHQLHRSTCERSPRNWSSPS